MKASTHKHLCFLAGLLFILLAGNDALASEGGSSWRGTYDVVMRWVNFGIMIFLFMKYVKTPLMNFLNSKKEAIAEEIKTLEEAKENADARNREATEKMKEGDAHITRIKERIINEGEKVKNQIIEEARKQSQYILEDAKTRAGSQIVQAQKEFRAELVDAAMALALEKLPNIITEKDDQVLLDNYLASAKE